MEDNHELDKLRKAVLNDINKYERYFRLSIVSASLVEAGFIIFFLIIADHTSALHWLIFIAAMATYTIIGIGLFSLGFHINLNAQRILKAIYLNKDSD